jgi:hypothetical protein
LSFAFDPFRLFLSDMLLKASVTLLSLFDSPKPQDNYFLGICSEQNVVTALNHQIEVNDALTHPQHVPLINAQFEFLPHKKPREIKTASAQCGT